MYNRSFIVYMLFGINLSLFGYLLYLNGITKEKQKQDMRGSKIRNRYSKEDFFPTIVYSKSSEAQVNLGSAQKAKNKDITACFNPWEEKPSLRLRAIKDCLPLFKEYRPSATKENKKIVPDIPDFVPKFGEAPSVVSYPYETVEWKKMYKSPLSKENILNTLGFYTATAVGSEYYNDRPDASVDYETPNFGIFNMDDYCNVHDILLQYNPQIAFQKYFVTDYHHLSLPRMFVMNRIGEDLMPKVSKNMHRINFYQKLYSIDFRTSVFYFKKADFHFHHALGRHFNCFGQSYNHIPGHGEITRKDLLTKNSMEWVSKFSSNPSCLRQLDHFPHGLRLNDKSECLKFFATINSSEYMKRPARTKKFIIKAGYDSHRGSGVFILDEVYEKSLREQFDNGARCGNVTSNFIAQEYIDPPLLYKGYKFDFRMYMLVSSTNPLKIYYHDGFLRISLDKYDRTSSKPNIYATNTELSKDIIKKCERYNTTYNNMTANELREFQMKTMEEFSQYLYQAKVINDTNWLNNYLRPEIKRSFISSVKMIEKSLHKSSNYFEIFGVDIILDSQARVKILEINASPMVIGTNARKTKMMKRMLKGLFNIVFAQQFSRNKRSLEYLQKNASDIRNNTRNSHHLEKIMKLYKNDVSEEYKSMLSNNTWQLIYDENLEGSEKYMNLIDADCAKFMDENA